MSTSKAKKGTRPIKTEFGNNLLDEFHDSNNNCARAAPEWKSFLREGVGAGGNNAPSEDVYQFDDDDEETIKSVKKNVLSKAKDNSSSKSKLSNSSPCTKIPIVKSEILNLKRELSMEEDERGPAGKATHMELYQNKAEYTQAMEETTDPKPECRKSARRRPSVLYIEDPFQIILDSDEFEDFDFENGDFYLNRRSENIKKSRPRGRKATAPKQKLKIPVLKKHYVQADPGKTDRSSPEICEYRIEPVTPRSPVEDKPQVNPIFLWVRQEDSLIVDVRCEDYDRRNRIRLTKSANGSWRAMPRTEPDSSIQDQKLQIKSSCTIMHKRRSKSKKNKKKKKRHRHHKNEVIVDTIKYPHNIQTCKVSLVPLPELILDRAKEGVSVNLTSQRSNATGSKEYERNETHVPNASEGSGYDDDCANNNNNNVIVKRKHVRFALDHSDSSNEQSGQEGNMGAQMRQYTKREQTLQCNSSAGLSARKERPRSKTDAPGLLELSDYRTGNNNTNTNCDIDGPFSLHDKRLCALDNVVVKEEEGMGKLPKSMNPAANIAMRGDWKEIENDEAVDENETRAQRPGNASPTAVTIEPLLQTSVTQRQRTARRGLQEGQNNNKNNQEQKCILSASPEICTNTVTDSSSAQTPIQQELSEQGARIFTAADDVNNKLQENKSFLVNLGEKEDTIVISDCGSKGSATNNNLVIEVDDQEVLNANENPPERIVDQSCVIEINEQDGDDDVTFVCSKSAPPQCLEDCISRAVNTIDEIKSSSNNNNRSSAGGDALPGQQPRILTPEEQLHESLKATTELIAGIGGFGLVSSVGEEENTMSFTESSDNHYLGGSPRPNQDIKISLPISNAQQRMSNALHKNLSSLDTDTGTTQGALGDEYNDDDGVLMDAVHPVADIISRLSDSPKCLTFNEMGEIEAISANAALFEKHTMDSMDVLAMSIKELAEKNIKEIASKAVVAATISGNSNSISTLATADSYGGSVSGEEYPRDLTLKQDRDNTNKTKSSPMQRPVSRGSDAIQSPQPSGLPAIPQSPDIFLNSSRPKSVFLESILTTPSPSKPQTQQSRPQQLTSDGGSCAKQKEPLDLGTCRKSASPTVTCSEEVSKRRHDEIVDLVSELESSSASSSTSESSRKRIKYESASHGAGEKLDTHIKTQLCRDKTGDHSDIMESSTKGESHKTGIESVTGYLMDILNTNAKDPDPLTQLRLLISNTEWKVPETLLVPKDRLNAVLASPAREIPLLLTTRPELRLPGAFAFPSILQDPDILVVSLAQLEAILEKQHEIFKLKATERHTVQSKRELEVRQKNNSVSSAKLYHISEKQQENLMHQQIQRAISNKFGAGHQKHTESNAPVNVANAHGAIGSGLANEIDAATIAAFNQMLWLPYLNQMRGQITPEVLKAVAGFNEMLPLLAAQSRMQQGVIGGPTNSGGGNSAINNSLNTSLEYAMWQEAMLNANNANLRTLLKGQHADGSTTEVTKKQLDDRKALSAASANFTAPGKISKSENQNLPNPLSPITMPPFMPPAGMQGASRYFTPLGAASQQQNHRSPAPSPTIPMLSPFSQSYRQQLSHQQNQQAHQPQRGSQRFNMFTPAGQSQLQNAKKAGLVLPPNHFYPFGQNTQVSMDFEDQMNLFATKKAQKELEQVLQLQQHQQRIQNQQAKLAQEQKLNKLFPSSHAIHLNSFLNSAKMSYNHQQQQQQQHMLNQQMMNQLNELSKLSSLMAMPSAFDSPLNPNNIVAGTTGHDQSRRSPLVNEAAGSHQQPKVKLKVKPGLHLLDPMAMQRRLLTNHSTESSDELAAEIVSTTTTSQSGMDTSSPDINSPLWHPLFGNR